MTCNCTEFSGAMDAFRRTVNLGMVQNDRGIDALRSSSRFGQKQIQVRPSQSVPKPLPAAKDQDRCDRVILGRRRERHYSVSAAIGTRLEEAISGSDD